MSVAAPDHMYGGFYMLTWSVVIPKPFEVALLLCVAVLITFYLINVLLLANLIRGEKRYRE